MKARNNHAVVEGLATMGLGHDVPFLWGNWPIDAVHVSNAMRRECLHIPQMDDATTDAQADATVALALMGVQAHGSTDFTQWAETGLRREALAALELGAAAGKVALKMPHMAGRLDALFTHLVNTIDRKGSEESRMLQTLLLGAFEYGSGLSPRVPWETLSEPEVMIGKLLQEQLPTADNTEKRAAIVATLIPQETPSCMDDKCDGKTNEPRSPQQQVQATSGEGGESSEPGQPDGESEPCSKSQEAQDPASWDGQAKDASTGDSDLDLGSPPGEAESRTESPINADDSGSSNGGVHTEGQPGVSQQSDQQQASTENSPVDDSDQNRSPQQPAEQQLPEGSESMVGSSGASDAGGEPATEVRKQVFGFDAIDATDEDSGSVLGYVLGEGAGAGGADAVSLLPAKAPMLRALEARIVTSMLRVLQAKCPRSRGLTNSGPRVVASRAWRFKHLGDSRIFRKPVQRAGIDVAISILLDRSGSMSKDSRMQVARDSVIAFANAMERINGVKTAIAVFPGVLGADGIQPFDGSVRKARDEIAGVQPLGSTPLDRAIRKVLPDLTMRKESRKVLLIVTDGRPNDLIAAVAQIQQAKAQGVQVMGIGIACDMPMDMLVEQNMQISDESELPEALVRLFDDMLIQA